MQLHLIPELGHRLGPRINLPQGVAYMKIIWTVVKLVFCKKKQDVAVGQRDPPSHKTTGGFRRFNERRGIASGTCPVGPQVLSRALSRSSLTACVAEDKQCIFNNSDFPGIGWGLKQKWLGGEAATAEFSR